jgi:hypothetical protein
VPRKAKPEALRKTASVSFRTTEALKSRLEAEATRNARSLAKEIEYRLERTLSDDEAETIAFGQGPCDWAKRKAFSLETVEPWA